MKWRHFKGGVYELIGVSRHSETLEWHVIYRDANGDLWSRPFDMFFELVDDSTAAGGNVPRFTPVQAHRIEIGLADFPKPGEEVVDARTSDAPATEYCVCVPEWSLDTKCAVCGLPSRAYEIRRLTDKLIDKIKDAKDRGIL